MTASQLQSASRRAAAPGHKADAYFAQKFRSTHDHRSREIIFDAHAMRHRFPDLTGPELVRLAYWGVSGVAS